MEWANLAWIIPTIIVVAGAMAVFFATFQTKRVDRIIETQKLSISTLEENNDILNKAMESLKADFKACKDRLLQQEQTISVLQDQVTGATAIAKLTAIVVEQHEESMAVRQGKPRPKKKAKR